MSEPTPLADAATVLLQRLEEANHIALPRPHTGPVMCEACGEKWLDCTCDETGITRNLFAFRDVIGGMYKVWSSVDTIHMEHEDSQGRSQSIIFLPSELTHLAQTWLAMQEPDGTTHEHVYTDTFDPRYEACSCGVARQKQGYSE